MQQQVNQSKRDVLSQLNFGARIAEDESEVLSQYFVETDQWRRLYRGEVDVVYGPKGSGKSALYSLLLAKDVELIYKNIILVTAENPRGAAAFQNLVVDPPASEAEFVGLWKLYIASLISNALDTNRIDVPSGVKLKTRLAEEGLVKGDKNLQSLLRTVQDYVKRIMKPKAVEGEIHVDPASQMPKGFSGKIIFAEPGDEKRKEGFIPIDELLGFANEALVEAKLSIWVLLDRLDVAFSDSPDLEGNALRALFRVYLDMKDFKNICLKVFLRTDIWNRVTQAGFREASHITKHMTISWEPGSLLNLVVRRALHNPALREYYVVDASAVLKDFASQEKFFYRLFPDQVEVGRNKPTSFDWMLGRTRDGTGETAPRELIHLLNSARNEELRKLERGEAEAEGQVLFTRPTLKAALPEVSEVRLNQTIYAEYPALKEFIEKLRQQKSEQTLESLSEIWSTDRDQTAAIAERLVGIGFMVEKRETEGERAYWIPFLYRDALKLIQGAA